MKRRVGMVSLGTCAILAVLAASSPVAAESIEVSPESWDFGDVEVGNSDSKIFTINSTAETELTVYIIELTDDDSDAFSITSAPTIPVIIPGGESEEVEVTLTPPELGAHDAFLHIFSNAPGNHTYVDLFGVGVEAPAWGAASSLGTESQSASDALNYLLILLAPVGILMVWKGLRKRI